MKKLKNRKHYPLIDAATSGFLDIISFKLKRKEVDINQVSSEKIDAITAAVKNNHMNVVKCLMMANSSLVRHLKNNKNFDVLVFCV